VSLAPEALAEWLNQQGMFGPVLLMLLMILAVVCRTDSDAAYQRCFRARLRSVQRNGDLPCWVPSSDLLLLFYLARVLGREAVRRKLGDNPVFSATGSQRFLFMAVTLTRLIPLFSFALISYAAGVTAISFWRYALATTLGMLPMTSFLPDWVTALN